VCGYSESGTERRLLVRCCSLCCVLCVVCEFVVNKALHDAYWCVERVLCVVCCVLCVVCCVLCVVCCVLCVVVLCVVCCVCAHSEAGAARCLLVRCHSMCCCVYVCLFVINQALQDAYWCVVALISDVLCCVVLCCVVLCCVVRL
jgi:hypothetical protein